MPNYVKNRITFNSEKELRLAFSYLLGKLYKPELDEESLSNLFSFELIVPKPKTAEECEKKFGKEYLYTKDSHIQVDEDFPFLNWYEWQCRFWGCKWDACNRDVSYNWLEFDTPWSPPEPVMLELCKKIPNIPFTWEFSEEQGIGGFAGYLRYKPVFVDSFSEAEPGNFEEVENFDSKANEKEEVVFFETDEEIADMYNELWGTLYYKAANDGKLVTEYDTEDETTGVLYDGMDFYHFDVETKDGEVAYKEKKKEIEGNE